MHGGEPACPNSVPGYAYWHEKATRKPPPPGAVFVLVVRVKMVPAARFDAAVALQVDPPLEPVEQLMTGEPAVHVFEVVLALTVSRSHVTPAPTYE